MKNPLGVIRRSTGWHLLCAAGMFMAPSAPAATMTLVSSNAVWRYLVTPTDPGTTWRASGFNDLAWPSGPAQLGFGDGDESTVLTGMSGGTNGVVTAYFRKSFVVTNAGAVTNLNLGLVRDDGAVVYLNGTEVRRDNLPSGDINHFTLATSAVGGTDESTFFSTMFLPSALVTGTNVVAVEVHQNAVMSTDLSFALQLIAQTSASTNQPPVTNYPPVVRLVSPTNGAVFTAPTNLVLAATAYDPGTNGRVLWLEFYTGTNRLGTVTNMHSGVLGTNFFFEWMNAPTGTHVLTVKARDHQGAVSTSPPVTVSIRPAGPNLLMGFLRWEVYTNIPGMTVADLTNHPSYPAHPSFSNLLSSFETPEQVDDNFGARISGFVLPPVTGDYVFYISSDDQGALFLSSDESPANKVQIAWEPTWSPVRQWVGIGFGRTNNENISPPIRLEAGRRYYVEALHKEGGGGDHLGVAWQMPGELPPEVGAPPIPGTYLATFGSAPPNLPPVVRLVSPVNGATFTAPTNLVLVATAYDPDLNGRVLWVEFFAGTNRLGLVTNTSSSTLATNFFFEWMNAPTGTHSLTVKARDIQGAVATSTPVNITVLPAPSDTRELHVVGIYSGTVPGGGSSRTNEQGQASLVVNRPGQRVTLFLSSYEPVFWHATVGQGTVIEKVFLAGYYRQQIDGLPAGVEVVPAWLEGRGGDYLWIGYTVESGAFYYSIPKINDLTGLPISSFHGGYQAPYPTPFIIDAVQNDPRLSTDYPQPVPPSQVPSLNFSLAFRGGGTGSNALRYQSYTLQGPVTGSRLQLDTRVLPDQSGRYYFGLGSSGIWKVDSQTGVSQELSVPPGLPELSWPMGVAFDSQRQRALLVSLGGEGFLYAYAPAQDQWSLVASMANRDLDNLVYHSAQDALYGVGMIYGNDMRPPLYRFSAEGVYQSQFQLPHQPFGYGSYGLQSELVSLGNYLVWLLESPSGAGGSGNNRESRIYLLDPRSQQVWLTYRQVERPPAVQITWPTPAPIVYGTALGSAQLNATANVPGTFSYSPPAGIYLGAGTHTLSVTFTPRDWPGSTATATVGLTVLRHALAITADNKTKYAGQPNPPLTASYSGFVAGDGPEVLDVPATLTTTATIDSRPGTYVIIASGASDANYSVTHVNGTLTVLANPPVITQQPVSQTRLIGQTATFSVKATGTPPLHFQWQFYTMPIAAATHATLTLLDLQVTNNGYYRVIITNVAGAVTSLVAQLEVFEPPTQPGQMDPLFSARLSHRGYVDALAQQPDGRCYVAGFFDQINGVGRGSLARLWPNGDVDLSFVPPPCLTVNALAVQPDGKVLANLGFSGVPSRVARLHSDGSLDTTFTPYTNVATSVLAVQPDGQILVASRSPVRHLVRLHSDGRPDPSFTVGVDGVAVDYAIRAVTPLPNGQLLIGGGFNTVNGIARDGVARLNSDGTVDPTFNPVANPDAWVNCLTVLPGEKILIAGGFGWQNGLPRRAIARLNPDGSLDPTFDPGAGIGPGDVEIHAIAVQADGRVLIGGNFFQVNGVPRNGFARLNADGRLDPSFINPLFSTSDDTRMSAIVIQSADMALVAGDDPAYAIGLVRVYLGPMVMPPAITTQPASQTCYVGQLARFFVEANGTPPLRYQWQEDGTVLNGQTNASLILTSVQPEQAGHYTVTVRNRFGSAVSITAILMVVPQTQPGVSTAWVTNMPGAWEECVLFVDASGHAYVAGHSQVVKFSPEGQRLWVAPFDRPGGGEGGRGWPAALTADAAGQVYVTGYSKEPAGNFEFTTIKLNAAGQRLWAAHFGRPGSRDRAVAIGVDAAGNVFVGGSQDGGQAVTLKYDAVGNELWVAYLNAPNGSSSYGGLAVDPDGHAHVTGLVGTAQSGSECVTIKYDTDGQPLWTARYGPPGEDASPQALALDPSGHVYVTGGGMTNNQPALLTMKYSPEGTRLWVAHDFDPPTSGRGGHAIAVGPSGSVYVAAQGFGNDGNEESCGFATLMYDPSGRPVWASRFIGTYHGGGGLAVDGAGNAYVTAALGEFAVRAQPVTIKYAPDGNQLWAMPFPLDGRWGKISVLGLDAGANVYVAGTVWQEPSGYHYLLAKYTQTPEPPTIIQQPIGQTKFAGQTATFSVVARGTPPLRYQWLFEGAPISNATNATLTLVNVPPTQAGAYSMVVANAAGRTTSGTATLTVLPAPTGPGSLDLTFDPTRGGELIGPATEQGEVLALARQPDGKLVIGGQFSGYNGSLRRHIARIHPNGTLDEGFNPGLGVDGHVYAVALQPNGQMLVGGSFSVFDTQPCSSLVRLNPDGSLDTGFNAALARYGAPGMVRAIVVQSDGKILVGGSFSEVSGVARTNVARLNPDGSLDAGFVPASGAPDWYQGVVSLTVLADGKLLVGGRFLGEGKLLCRLQPDGSLDSTFATELTGYGLIQFGVRSDGKIYAVGQFDVARPGWNYSRLMLLNADGTIDPEFVVDFDNVGFYCFAALAVQPDDRVLVSGWFHSVNNVLRDQVARLNPDGSLDESFDPGDTLGEWSPTGDAHSMVLEPDGHIWLGGLAPLANGSQTALVRLQPNGEFDEAFYMEAGEVNVAGDSISIQALATLPDGRVYVGGGFTSFNHQPRVNLARLLPDGTLDSSFDPAWSNRFEVSLLKLQPDGNLLAGSSSELVRFHPDGSLDPSFVGHLHDTLGMRIHCLALQADGKIVIGGEFADGLARLNPDGSLDDTFHPPYLPAYDGDAVYALAVQPDGKILFGGTGAIGFERLLPDGSVDPTFNCDGVIGHVFDILLPSDGSILVGGRPCLTISDEARGLARLHPDGRVDETFNAPLGDYVDAVTVAPDGHIFATAPEIVGGWPTRIYRLDPDGSVDAAFQARLGLVYGPPVVADILVQSDGQVVIGGTFTSVNGIPVDGLARLNNDLSVPTAFVQREIASSGKIRLVALPSMHVSVYAVEDQPPAGWPVSNISQGGVFDARTGKVKFGPFFDHQARTLTYQITPPTGFTGIAWLTGVASADGVDSPIGGANRIVVPWPHPADNAPANWSLTISEVAAYASAWRRSQPWPSGPNPIPIDYVTRAALLWRAGECYLMDAAITNAPLWWIACAQTNHPGALTLTAPAPATIATRQAPAAFVPGQPVAVAITVTPSPSATACAIEEQPPAGWIVTAISHGGEFDAASGQVKWGPYFDNTPRTLTYQATPPTAATGLTGFAGTASIDGAGMAISGVQQMRAACRVTLSGGPSAGALEFTLASQLGARMLIEVSTDLTSWSELVVLTNTTGRIQFTDPDRARFSHRFYRARVLE